jgi:hypothetical protein
VTNSERMPCARTPQAPVTKRQIALAPVRLGEYGKPENQAQRRDPLAEAFRLSGVEVTGQSNIFAHLGTQKDRRAKSHAYGDNKSNQEMFNFHGNVVQASLPIFPPNLAASLPSESLRSSPGADHYAADHQFRSRSGLAASGTGRRSPRPSTSLASRTSVRGHANGAPSSLAQNDQEADGATAAGN